MAIELPDVTQKFIADVVPYLEAMQLLEAETQKATADVQELIDTIGRLDSKVVTITIKTVGDLPNIVQPQVSTGAIGAETGAYDRLDEALAVTLGLLDETGRQTAELRAQTDAARDAVAALGLGFSFMDSQLTDVNDRLTELTSLAAAANAQLGDMAGDMARTAAASEATAAGIRDLATSMAALAVASRVTRAAMTDAGTGAAAAGAGATAAAAGFRIWGTGIRLTGAALHWIVAGTAEFLAVAVPAAIALAAGLAVAAQGAQNVYEHFTALYAATESTASAFHQTVGTTLGLGDALQKAQDAANPGVYELLGSAVNDAKSGFSSLATVGLQVVHMFDEFAARITVDLKSGMGTEIQGLLSGMVTDLQEFGQVLGNLGHALLNFAAAMPGLAHVLLAVADGISQVILWASKAGVFLTFVIAMEEVFRWGGLLLGMLARLAGAGALFADFAAGGGFLVRFGSAIKALVVQGGEFIMWLGEAVVGLDGIVPAAGAAGQATIAFGADVAAAGEEMSANWIVAIVAVAAALTFLAVKLASAKDATQQWIDKSNQAVQSASDMAVLGTIAKTLAENTIRLSAAQANLNANWGNTAQVIGVASRYTSNYSGATARAAQDTAALSNQQRYLIGTADNVMTNLGALATHFHTTAVGALALANAAGVNLQVPLTHSAEAMKIAEQQVQNLKTGLGAMSAPAGVIGADMEAIGIQSQLASSKVQTVNQALDAFIAGTTGGMNSVMQFNAALRAMGKDTVSGSQNVAGAINTISASAAKMGYTLQGFGAHAQQSWQQFDAAVQQGNSVLDTFRTGMAEGVVSSQQYNNEIRAVGGSLLPFAAHNKTALAIVSQLSQEMGNPATSNLKTLAAQFGITGRAAQNMATVGMEQAVARMANMNVVARNLSVTVGTQLDTAMASAITKFSGVQGAANNYAKALANAQTPASVLAQDQKAFNTALQTEASMTTVATGDINKHAGALGNLGSAYKGANTSASDFAGSTKQASDSLMNAQASAKTAALSAQGFGQQAHTAASSATGLSTNAAQANTQVRALGVSANVTRGNLGTVNNEIRTTASAASSAQGPLIGMSNNIRAVGSAAAASAGEVRALESAIASLQSKTITITTVMATVHRAAGGPVFPGVPTMVGEAGSELYVPAVPGYIFNHEQTQQILSPVASPEMAVAIGGGGSGTAVIHNHVYLDGQQIWENQQQATLKYNARNGNSGSGIVSPRSVAKG